ncbi:MAG: DUF5615 family PIN-like protein [Anaerolineae bacterium]
MNDIRYLMDENVNPLFRTELLKREPKLVVWKVGDPGAPPEGTLDPAILRWCEENLFTLVTNNRRSMPQHLRDHLAEGRHIPGILEVNPNMSIGETIEELLLIWGVSDADEYHDMLIYLPLS